MRDERDVTVVESDSAAGLKWFVLGAAIGAGLGILFAPQSGERTRRVLARRARKLRVQAGEKLEDLAGELETRGRRIKDSVEEFAEEIVDDVREGRRALEHGASTAREEMEQRLANARTRRRAAVSAGNAGSDNGSDDPTA